MLILSLITIKTWTSTKQMDCYNETTSEKKKRTQSIKTAKTTLRGKSLDVLHHMTRSDVKSWLQSCNSPLYSGESWGDCCMNKLKNSRIPTITQVWTYACSFSPHENLTAINVFAARDSTSVTRLLCRKSAVSCDLIDCYWEHIYILSRVPLSVLTELNTANKIMVLSWDLVLYSIQTTLS